MAKKPMTFTKLLTRRHPKLMRKWLEDGSASYDISVKNDLTGAATVNVRLVFSNGRVEDIELLVGT